MIKLALMKTFLSRKINIYLAAARKRPMRGMFLFISFGLGRFILSLARMRGVNKCVYSFLFC